MIHNAVNQDLDTENLLIANSIYPTLKNEHFILIMKSMLYIGPNKTNRQKNILTRTNCPYAATYLDIYPISPPIYIYIFI